VAGTRLSDGTGFRAGAYGRPEADDCCDERGETAGQSTENIGEPMRVEIQPADGNTGDGGSRDRG
jgi:hypothetical protein